MITKKLTGVLFASTLILGLVFSNSASAAFEPCTGTGFNIADNVTPNIGCTVLSPYSGSGSGQNDSPQPGFVNTAGFFGITDWLFDGKYDNINSTSGTDTSTLFNFTGGSQSGTFTKASDAILSDIMLIFKDGADTNLVGYKIDPSVSGGVYTSPFEEPPFNFSGTGPRDISHISVYYRRGQNGGGGGGGSVPEPGMIALLGTGLLGFGLTHLRKRKKA
ncbi:MAG: PEP-CTERM sorting domain-containing protein [Methylicorpusculum sp.]|uniref:PEP-CTERM sorting domain-containing protein n=1 Tax=Methylicorpusculum sp. TaxID=2713644 RepID=UPI002715C7E3|nr:PEP-CTERM sorting domain-containing protein [Methylicorpusculum sp.]MDO8937565.1 PEP-CTERM sorting domain-containing protein [Methylicorpusculum sp.]MDP2203098.1 PEP-CTERM sorting domain-containing protein [Methylicorpusculum sp.]